MCFRGFPAGSVVKNLPMRRHRRPGFDALSGVRSPGGEHGNPLQYSCPESHGQRSLVGYSPQGAKR